MRKLSFIFIAIAGLFSLFSCKKDETQVVFTNLTTAQIQSPVNETAYILTKETVDSVLTTFTWNKSVSSPDNLGSASYALEMDTAGNNFAKPTVLVAGEDQSFSIKVSTMNALLLGEMKDLPDVEGVYEFRIKASLFSSSTSEDKLSDVITLRFTPFLDEVILTYPKLYVPGDYQGWAPATAPNIYDFDDDGVYTGYLYFPEGGTFEFKFTSDPDWDHTNYGAGAGAGLLDTDAGAGNLTVPGPGGYQVEVDIINKTWSYTAQNWSITGEWLAWAADEDLLWDATNQYLYFTGDIPAATNNRFKFRADHAWDINLGAKAPDDGTLVQGGADIPIPEAGNYTFILRFTTPEPSYELIKN